MKTQFWSQGVLATPSTSEGESVGALHLLITSGIESLVLNVRSGHNIREMVRLYKF